MQNLMSSRATAEVPRPLPCDTTQPANAHGAATPGDRDLSLEPCDTVIHCAGIEPLTPWTSDAFDDTPWSEPRDPALDAGGAASPTARSRYFAEMRDPLRDLVGMLGTMDAAAAGNTSKANHLAIAPFAARRLQALVHQARYPWRNFAPRSHAARQAHLDAVERDLRRPEEGHLGETGLEILAKLRPIVEQAEKCCEAGTPLPAESLAELHVLQSRATDGGKRELFRSDKLWVPGADGGYKILAFIDHLASALAVGRHPSGLTYEPETMHERGARQKLNAWSDQLAMLDRAERSSSRINGQVIRYTESMMCYVPLEPYFAEGFLPQHAHGLASSYRWAAKAGEVDKMAEGPSKRLAMAQLLHDMRHVRAACTGSLDPVAPGQTACREAMALDAAVRASAETKLMHLLNAMLEANPPPAGV